MHQEPVKIEPKKDYGPVIRRERNSHGDFVVKKVVIPDLVVPQVVEDKAETSSEESEEEVKAVVEEAKVKGKFPIVIF